MEINKTPMVMEKNRIEFQGNFLYFDQKNLNGVTYTKKVAEKIIEQFKEQRGEDGVFFGELGQDRDDAGINISNVSHDVIELKINENNKTLEGTILLLETSAGKKALEMLKDPNNYSISCRPRGIGKVNDRGEIEEYQIISFDLIPTSLDSFGQRDQLK